MPESATDPLAAAFTAAGATPAPADPLAAPDPPAAAPPAAPDPADQIIAQADNPDSVRRLIDTERETAREEKRRSADAYARARDLEAQLDAQIQASKPLEQQIAEARAEAESARIQALRYEVASEQGIPFQLASRLTGSTKEELAADADTLKAFVAMSGQPAPSAPPDGGVRITPPAKSDPTKDHNSFILQAIAARQGSTGGNGSLFSGLEPAPAGD